MFVVSESMRCSTLMDSGVTCTVSVSFQLQPTFLEYGHAGLSQTGGAQLLTAAMLTSFLALAYQMPEGFAGTRAASGSFASRASPSSKI